MLTYLNSNDNKLLWYGLGCAILGLAMCIITLLVGLIFFNWAFQEPDNARVYLQIPETVKQDDPVSLGIQIESLDIRPIVVNSIELSPDYLAGIQIETSQPPFLQSVERPYSHDQAYTFNISLEPGEILLVELSGVAVQTGSFSGEVDVCVDGMIRCLSYGIQTVVEE